jgi:prolyl-tRNA synthetase
VKIDRWEDFAAYFTPKCPDKPELHGGFALAHWDGSREVEDQIKEELKVTIRCIPLEGTEEHGACIRSGRPSTRRVVFAKAY